jgi:hypothetical protein
MNPSSVKDKADRERKECALDHMTGSTVGNRVAVRDNLSSLGAVEEDRPGNAPNDAKSLLT